MVLKEARGEVKYKFMRKVILPEASQKEMYNICAAHYDEAITMQMTDCMVCGEPWVVGVCAQVGSDWRGFDSFPHRSLTFPHYGSPVCHSRC